MGLLDKFLRRAPAADLPTLEALLQARGLATPVEALAPLRPAFDHLSEAAAREAWVEALAELEARRLPLPSAWEDVQDEILPQLVPAWQADREGLWGQLCIEGLRMRVLVDGAPMHAAVPKLWDLSAQTVADQAIENLRRRTDFRAFEKLPTGIYQSPYKDGLDAARLLLPALWMDLIKDQRPFMAIPHAGCLLVSPQVLLPKLVEAISQNLGKGPLLQASLMERVGDQWLPARLQEPHPISNPQRELRNFDLMQALRTQEQDLDPALGRPAPVAMVNVGQGKTVLMATWTAGEPCLLPEADLIAFCTKEGAPLGIYQRQSLPRIAELRGEPVEIWGPRRQRFTGFPSGEQRELLERFATAEQMLGLMKSAQGQGQPQRAAAPAPQQPPARPAHLRDVQLGVQSED